MSCNPSSRSTSPLLTQPHRLSTDDSAVMLIANRIIAENALLASGTTDSQTRISTANGPSTVSFQTYRRPRNPNFASLLGLQPLQPVENNNLEQQIASRPN